MLLEVRPPCGQCPDGANRQKSMFLFRSVCGLLSRRSVAPLPRPKFPYIDITDPVSKGANTPHQSETSSPQNHPRAQRGDCRLEAPLTML